MNKKQSDAIARAALALAEKNRLAMKEAFIRRLAHYLVVNQATRSIQLQLGRPEAMEWSEIRNLTPLFGYPTIDEAMKTLTAFLK
jgi:hypothetical protein